MKQLTHSSCKQLLFCMLTTVLFFNGLTASGQIQEDFSDGDFSSDPPWEGDVSSFIVNNDKQLQLNDDLADTSYLSTPNLMIAETEWRFYVKCAFSPSANNFCRIYLVSNKKELSSALNAYYLQLGESGTSDAIELYRQTGNEHQLLCRGSDGFIADPFSIRIKVTRTGGGKFTIYADPSGNQNFVKQAEAFDATHTSTAFFGIFCKYTISNSSKMYFDDFYAGPLQYDTSPPAIEALQTVSSMELYVHFNEAVKQQAAENPQNYTLHPDGVHPQLSVCDNENPSIVKLYFEEELLNEQSYQLTVNNMTDYSGNTAEELSADFVYFRPRQYDIVINEIMADPSPMVALPEYEYLELVNNTAFDIDLRGWKLQTGNSLKTFGDVILQAHSYLIVGNQEAASAFEAFGTFYGFESFSLTNSGQEVNLLDNYGRIISHLAYDDSWYRDKEKDDGGWSLEQIDQYNPCPAESNWKASESPLGGTPGKTNSVDSDIAESPYITRTGYLDDNSIVIYFSQKMDSSSILDPASWLLDKNMGQPASVESRSPYYNDVIIRLKKPMQPGVIYEITPTGIYNCAGIPPENNIPVKAGIPAEPRENDLVINEVLFNPKGDGVDYVEIYNRSDKIIALNSLLLASVMQTDHGPDSSSALICVPAASIFPASYLLLSPSSITVKQQYYTKDPAAFLEMSRFPKLNADEGMLMLQDTAGYLIDKMLYSEAMQYPLLNSYEGVALERINHNRTSSDESNWQSAAANKGYGTPAYRNSQFVPESEANDPVSVSPEIFSPDADGKDDVLNISYEFDKSGYTAGISIFDAAGRKVRTLVNNEPIGSSGSFSWNGLNDNRQLVQTGIYVIYFEVFSPGGKVEKYKKTAVVAVGY